MKILSLAACVSVLACLGQAAGAATQPPPNATIVNSGSTNTAAFSVSVWSTARVQVDRKPPVSISQAAIKQFFADVRRARMGSSAAIAGGCMKSVSFGSVMRVHSGPWTSADLNCPVSGVNAALKADVNAILTAVRMDVPHPRIISLPSNEPRRMEPTPQPTGTP